MIITTHDVWYNRILRWLSFRPRSRQELVTYLKQKKVNSGVIADVVAKLEARNFINDFEFARWFIEQRNAFRPKAAYLLKLELKQKGIGGEIIEQLFAGEEVEDDVLLAKKIIQKKAKLFACLAPVSAKKKLINLLLRRGFSWQTIGQVLPEIGPDF